MIDKGGFYELNYAFKLNMFSVSKSFITGFSFFLAIVLTKVASAGATSGSLSAESFNRHMEEQHNSKPACRQNGSSLISLSVKNAPLKEIAAALDLSEPRIYQLVARAKAIGREYRQENG